MPAPKKSGKPKGSKVLYFLINSVFGVLFFVVPYKILIEGNFVGFDLFQYTLITMFTGTLIGSWFARILSGYFETEWNARFFIKNGIIILGYSTLIWLGLIGWIFSNYPIWDTLQLDVLKWLFFVKLMLFIIADYISIMITTGGKVR